MASIRNRAGRWRVQIRRQGSPNQFKSFATKADALAWARQIESEMDRGMFISRAEAERTTLAEILERYRREVTPAKASADREALRLALLNRHLGSFCLSRLTSREIASYRDYRLSLGRAGATVVKELNTLSHVIDTARRDWGIFLAENPVKLVRRPKVAPGRDRRLREGEFHKLLTACAESRSPALSVIVELAIETGMRLGELLSLEWRYVNLTARTAYLPQTKNGVPRTVPLSTRAVTLLANRPRSLTGRVFPEWGATTTFEHVWRRAANRAGLFDLHFHDLRHEAASRFFERGLNPIQVAAKNGTSFITDAEAIYASQTGRPGCLARIGEHVTLGYARYCSCNKPNITEGRCAKSHRSEHRHRRNVAVERKGKPAERRGRKVTGLQSLSSKVAGPPKRQNSPPGAVTTAPVRVPLDRLDPFLVAR